MDTINESKIDRAANSIILHVEHYLHAKGGELITYTERQRAELQDDIKQIILHFLKETNETNNY